MPSSFNRTKEQNTPENHFPGIKTSPQEESLVYIGTLTKPHGIRGAIRLFPEFSPLDNFAKLKSKDLYLKLPKVPATKPHGPWRLVKISGNQYNKGFVIIQFKECDTFESVELLRGSEVYVMENALWDLPEGKYYGFQLQGLNAINIETDAPLGIVTELQSGHSYDYIEIKKPDGNKFLIPYLPQFIEDVNLQEQTIRVRIIEGIDEL